MNQIFTLFTFIIFGASVFAQGQTRTYVSMNKDGNSIVINVSDGSYHFTYLSPDVVQTGFVPNGETMNERSHAIITLESSVQPGEKIECTEYLESLVIRTKTSKITVKIQKHPFNVEYLRNGERLFAENKGYQVMANGNKSLSFRITNDEALYGGGARALGMNRRGNRLELYNRAHYGYEERSTLMNYTMPIVISSKRYMIHFDNAPIGFLDLDSEKNNSIVYETVAGRMVYQVIGGNSWEDLIANYTSITGRQPLPPRWAFGNFASRFGYHSQAEVDFTVDQFFMKN